MLYEARCAESRFGVLLRNPNRVIIQLPSAPPKGQAPLPCHEHSVSRSDCAGVRHIPLSTSRTLCKGNKAVYDNARSALGTRKRTSLAGPRPSPLPKTGLESYETQLLKAGFPINPSRLAIRRGEFIDNQTSQALDSSACGLTCRGRKQSEIIACALFLTWLACRRPSDPIRGVVGGSRKAEQIRSGRRRVWWLVPTRT